MSSFEVEQTLSKLFNSILLRVPDYQRGYSWDKKQLNDLWEDTINLKPEQTHYTGMVTLTVCDKEDKWTGFETYDIVDGQQRLTSIIILLNEIILKAKELKLQTLNEIPITTLIKKYLYVENENNKEVKSSIFGYKKNDPANEFFQVKILGLKQPGSEITTAYTKKLDYARNYFKKSLLELNTEELGDLFKKVTENLIFNKYLISDKAEVSIVFESMNNRGKPLTTLELLKNRLIYLSEKMGLKPEEKEKLRSNINNSWKIVYEWLAKGLDILDDDDFLRNHWIMYFTYKREIANAFEENLLNTRFTLKKVYSNDISYDEINEYVLSLAEAVKHWNNMRYPEKNLSKYDSAVVFELSRLNRIGYTAFKPLVLAILMNLEHEPTTDVCSLLKSCEEYIFKVFAVSMKPSNTGDSLFYKLAREYYKKQKSISEIIVEIHSKLNNHFWFDNFITEMDENFKQEDGFYSWGYIRYFLFEYDLSLQEISKGKGRAIDWNTYEDVKKEYVSVEHIYPQDDSKECWQKIFGHFPPEQRKYLKGSLGNLLPLSIPRNSTFQNNCFNNKKNDSEGRGYYNGSYSEAEVNDNPSWDAEEILKRGIKLLEFMEKRWSIKIPDKEKLLHLEFLRNKSQKQP